RRAVRVLTTPCELVNSVISSPQPPWLRISLRNTVSVTPAMGASTVAGRMVVRPMAKSDGNPGWDDSIIGYEAGTAESNPENLLL
ncbi:MAG: hypothetical protein WB676_31340, partial [Bryobacteraceae bacterium]